MPWKLTLRYQACAIESQTSDTSSKHRNRKTNRFTAELQQYNLHSETKMDIASR